MSIEFVPTNEQGVIVAFAAQAQAAGWEFVSIGSAFPDAVLRKNGEEWRVEFEYRASNFLDHKHDHRECDMVICWENDYPDNPLPTLELSGTEWVHAELVKSPESAVAIEYWKRRALRAEAQNRIAISVGALRTDTTDAIVDSKKQMALSMGGQGKNAQEIAKLLNVNPNTVRSWIARERARRNGNGAAHE